MSRELRPRTRSSRSSLELRNEAGKHFVNLISLRCKPLEVLRCNVPEVSRKDEVIRKFTGRATCELQITRKVHAAIHAATFSDVRADRELPRRI